MSIFSKLRSGDAFESEKNESLQRVAQLLQDAEQMSVQGEKPAYRSEVMEGLSSLKVRINQFIQLFEELFNTDLRRPNAMLRQKIAEFDYQVSTLRDLPHKAKLNIGGYGSSHELDLTIDKYVSAIIILLDLANQINNKLHRTLPGNMVKHAGLGALAVAGALSTVPACNLIMHGPDSMTADVLGKVGDALGVGPTDRPQWTPNAHGYGEIQRLGLTERQVTVYPLFNPDTYGVEEIKTHFIDHGISPRDVAICGKVTPLAPGIVTLLKGKVDCVLAAQQKARFSPEDFVELNGVMPFEEAAKFPIGFGGKHIKRILGLNKGHKDIDQRLLQLFKPDEIIDFMEDNADVQKILDIRKIWEGKISAEDIRNLMRANIPVAFIQDMCSFFGKDVSVNEITTLNKYKVTLAWLNEIKNHWQGDQSTLLVSSYLNFHSADLSGALLDNMKELADQNPVNGFYIRNYNAVYGFAKFAQRHKKNTSALTAVKKYCHQGIKIPDACALVEGNLNRRDVQITPSDASAYQALGVPLTYDQINNAGNEHEKASDVFELKRRGLIPAILAPFGERFRTESGSVDLQAIFALDDAGLVRNKTALTYPVGLSYQEIIQRAAAGIDGRTATLGACGEDEKNRAGAKK